MEFKNSRFANPHTGIKVYKYTLTEQEADFIKHNNQSTNSPNRKDTVVTYRYNKGLFELVYVNTSNRKWFLLYYFSFNDPIEEVKIGNEILKSLNLRERGVKIISCPSCARQGFQVIDTVKILEEKLAHIKTPITLSIIGCVVNGPGEAAMTDIGITGGGKGNNMLYLSGIQSEKVLTNNIISKVVEEVEKKASELEKK